MGTHDSISARRHGEATSAERVLGPRPVTGTTMPRLSSARTSVLHLLMDQSAPVTVASLASALGQHENTVREHLDGLVTEGLATRARSTTARRGRPAWLYRAVMDRSARVNVEYAGLAGALAAHIARTSHDPAEDGRAAGRAWAQHLVREQRLTVEKASTPEEAVDRLLSVYEEFGFSPIADDARATLRMRRCPLLDAALRETEVVCSVHAGLTEGLIECLGGGPVDAEALPFDYPGACVMHLMRRPG